MAGQDIATQIQGLSEKAANFTNCSKSLKNATSFVQTQRETIAEIKKGLCYFADQQKKALAALKTVGIGKDIKLKYIPLVEKYCTGVVISDEDSEDYTAPQNPAPEGIPVQVAGVGKEVTAEEEL